MIIDYIGRMEKYDPRFQEWQMLEQIIKTQKMLAQNLQIAVMCLVQLNPDGTLQGAKRMKNECDLMLKLSPIPREDLVEDENLKKYVNPNYYIVIEKNRDGRSGVRIPIQSTCEANHERCGKDGLTMPTNSEWKLLYDDTASVIMDLFINGRINSSELDFLLNLLEPS